MSLEAASYITQLSESNPTSSDPTQQGDDHIRLIKGVLKSTFPNASGPVYFDSVLAEDDGAIPTNAESGTVYPITAAGGNVSISLPGTPDDRVEFTFYKSDFTPGIVTISGNGNTINGLTSVVLFKPYQKARFYYSAEVGEWLGDIDEVIETGTFIDNGSATLRNAIIADGTKTLGNTSSGADFLGNRYRQLYEHLWNTYPDGIAPVNGGRGLTSAADWTGNKRITMPALNGYIRVTQDNQGGLTASRVTNAGSGVDATAPGKVGGSQNVTLLRTHLPNVKLTGTTNTTGAHTHTYETMELQTNGGAENGNAFDYDRQKNTGSAGDHSHTVETDYLSGGASSQIALYNMPPVFTTRTHMAL